MALTVKYRGSFVGQRGTVWRADILVDGYAGGIGELTFPARKPLEIEWKETGKEDVLCGSTATLCIESPTDREYVHLYTIVPGHVALRVYRNSSLWWTGTLDPEFYEEPYERASKYDVKLTFQDFGILDRLKWNGSGVELLCDIVSDALSRASLGGLQVQLRTDTSVGWAHPEDLLDMTGVLGENFYDEDGEAQTLAAVLTGVLQPLGLRMVQRGGQVWLYDLTTLYDLTSRVVVWSGSRQTLGVDRVANRVKVTWSPYAQDGSPGDGTCWVTACLKNLTNIDNYLPASYANPDGSYSHYWSIHKATDPSLATPDDLGFTLWTNTTGKGATLFAEGLRFMKQVPHLCGDEVEGIALQWGVGWTTPDNAGNPYDVPYYYGYGVVSTQYGNERQVNLLTYALGHAKLFECSGIALPPVTDHTMLMLRLTVDMLLDVRFNPYVDAVNFANGGRTEKTFQERWQDAMNFVQVPVRLRFEPSDGSSALYWRRSMGIVQGIGTTGYAGQAEALEDTYGEWVSENSIGWLSWYDANDRDGSTGVTGWKENRQTVSPHVGELGGLFGMLDSGQYLPYPPVGCGGTLHIEVLDHWCAWSTDGTVDVAGVTYTKLLRVDVAHEEYINYMRWAMMKLPEMEIVKSDLLDMELNTDDVVYSGTINADALDDVELETVCGTARADRPTALGVYLQGGVPVQTFSRAGRTGNCEDLLIGTLHSQWATRHVKLTGEMEEAGEGLTPYTEANQVGLKLMKTGEILNAIEEDTKATLVELSPDEYTRRGT